MKTVQKLKENCCGCSACYSVCPQKAISMADDEHGFCYPNIDETKCVDCGLCRKACQFSNAKQNSEDIQRFFAIKHKDRSIVRNSQSGGAFTLFSDWILEQNGVVYGARLNTPELIVSHERAESIKERDTLKASKYVQSNMNDIFASVAKDLKTGRFVFFTGTPCQCDGLLSFIDLKRIDKEKLYTADLICHGVPSQKMFKSFVAWNEKKYKSKVSNFLFREKYKYPWGKHIEKISFENGRTVYTDWYANIFYNDCSLRDSCFNCSYATPVRNTDITFADFWGIGKCRPEMNDRFGCSSLIVHNLKGLDLLGKIRDNAIVSEVSKDDLVTPQPHLHGAAKKPDDYYTFWKDYKELEFSQFLLNHSYNTVTFANSLKTNFVRCAKFPFRASRKLLRILHILK